MDFKSFIESLKKQISIAEVVGKHVQLKKRSGAKYVAKCPLHKDDTPSFTIDDANGVFYCFGCLKGGDVINFTQELYGLSFNDAIESLASQYSIAVPSFSKQDSELAIQKKTQETIALQAIKQTAKVASKILQSTNAGKDALNYLVKVRRFDQSVINEFGFGLIGENFEALIKQEGVTQSELNIAGVYLDDYNRFNNRIVVPIHNKNAEIIGLGGRIYQEFQKQTAKYINSPETIIFKKNEVLFNYHRVRLQKTPFITVVEGYFDVIKLWQFGIKNALAPMGTNITEDHLSILFKTGKGLVFCFDSDNAGRAASLRAMKMCFKFLTPETSCKFMTLPDGIKDPDEMIDKHGADGFLALFSKNSNTSRQGYVADIQQAFFRSIIQGVNVKDATQRAKIESEIKSSVISQLKHEGLAKGYQAFFKFELDKMNFVKSGDVQKEIYGNASKNKKQDMSVKDLALGGGKLFTEKEISSKSIKNNTTTEAKIHECRSKILSLLISNLTIVIENKEEFFDSIDIELLDDVFENIYFNFVNYINELIENNKITKEELSSQVRTKFYNFFNPSLVQKASKDLSLMLVRIQLGLAILMTEAQITNLSSQGGEETANLVKTLFCDLNDLKLRLSEL
jgi:DNA primase catalytic core